MSGNIGLVNQSEGVGITGMCRHSPIVPPPLVLCVCLSSRAYSGHKLATPCYTLLLFHGALFVGH